MNNVYYESPTMTISEEIDKMKYRQDGETFDDKVRRIAGALHDTPEHKYELQDILGNMRFLPAGRVQNAVGSRRITTAYNCFVSGTIEDSMTNIMERASEAAETMRRGGGIGYDFSLLRPKGDLIKSLDSKSSGPVSFMGIFDSICQTIASSGHRRGAQMGVLRVDHPDIKDFLTAKRNADKLTGFNISVGVTDAFMEALKDEEEYELVFDGVVRGTENAQEIWEMIMSSTWDWAEPGVLFIDRIQEMNNLYYCEEIFATNPCGEQPLPPYGACLLGSFNLTKYLDEEQREDNVTFFEGAVDIVQDIAMQPLALKDIALEIDMHESTISRCTNNKYVQTPRGVFEMKHFFSSELNTDYGKMISSTAIKSMFNSCIVFFSISLLLIIRPVL